MEKSKELLKKHGMQFSPGHNQWRNERNVAWKMDERPRVNWSCKVEDSKMEAVRTEHSESAGGKTNKTKQKKKGILRRMRMCSHSWIFDSEFKKLSLFNIKSYSLGVYDIEMWKLLSIAFPTVKGEAVRLQAWSGPEGSRKLRFPDFTTMAQDSGKIINLMHRPPLPPGNAPGTQFL